MGALLAHAGVGSAELMWLWVIAASPAPITTWLLLEPAPGLLAPSPVQGRAR